MYRINKSYCLCIKCPQNGEEPPFKHRQADTSLDKTTAGCAVKKRKMCNNWILNGSEMKVGLGIAGARKNYVSETFLSLI